jgi:hypothetical protein
MRYKRANRAFWLCFYLVGALSVGALAQKTLVPKPAAQKKPVPETADSLVGLIAAAETKPDVRDKAWIRVFSLPEPNLTRAMRRLVAIGDPYYAAEAARVLVGWSDVDAVPSIAQKIGQWAPSQQYGVLLNITYKYSAPVPRVQRPATIAPYLPLVRQVTLHLLHLSVAEKVLLSEPMINSAFDPPGVAAELLAKGEVPADKATLRALLSQYPNSHGAWQSASGAGLVNEGDVAVARGVYSDPQKTDILCLAAAVAVADFAPDAEKYVTDYVTGLTTLYKDAAHSPQTSPWASPPTLPAPQSSTIDMKAFEKQLAAWDRYERKLANLMVLSSLSPAKLTFLVVKGMQSENPRIVSILAVVALRAVPALLLTTPPRTMPEAQFQGIYAYLVIYYPELRAQAAAIVPEAQLNKAIEAGRASMTQTTLAGTVGRAAKQK